MTELGKNNALFYDNGGGLRDYKGGFPLNVSAFIKNAGSEPVYAC